MCIAASGQEDTSFVAFSCAHREHWRPHRGYVRDRVTAVFGTLFVCGLFILLGTEPGLLAARTPAIPFEAVVELLPPIRARLPLLSTPFLDPLLRPKAERVAPPQFNIQSEEAATKAPLSVAVTPLPSPLIGGVQTQTTPGPPAGVSANGSSGNGNTPAGCFDAAWARAVSDHVQGFFYYPTAARALHVRGLVMVNFIERRDGSLDMVEVGKSSGWWALDDTAIDIIRKAQPLPAIPDRMHLDWIGLELPIDFGVRNVHLNPTPGNCG